MLRSDNAVYNYSVYSYPVTFEANTTYKFSWDFVMGGSGTPPLEIQTRFGLDETIAGRIVTHTDMSTSSTTVCRHSSWIFTTTSAGTYNLTINGLSGIGWFVANN